MKCPNCKEAGLEAVGELVPRYGKVEARYWCWDCGSMIHRIVYDSGDTETRIKTPKKLGIEVIRLEAKHA